MAETFCSPLRVVNVVLTGRLVRQISNPNAEDTVLYDSNYEFNLWDIAHNIKGPCVEFFPKKFAALKLCRVIPYFSKCLFFKSGKIVCVGNTSVEHGLESTPYFTDCISKALGGGFVLTELEVQNIVASTHIYGGKNVDLVKASKIFSNTQYEPELFPGCAFRYGPEWKQVINCFSSGKAIVTGVKDVETMKLRVRTFIEALYKHRVELGIV